MDRHATSLSYALNVLSREEYKQYINAIYLFGSCARGEQKYQSDVDLLLKLKNTIPKKTLRLIKCEVTPDDADLPEVNVAISFTDSFSTNWVLEREIRRDGILIWER